MNTNLILILFLLVFSSCSNDIKYEDVATHPNYYDSLYNISFIRNIKPFVLSDNTKTQIINTSSNSYFDSLLTSDSYLLNGIQNINLFKELENSYKLNKPLLIYFTAYGCTNCRRIEDALLNVEEVKSFIDNEFLFIPLTVDDRTELPWNHWVENPLINKQTHGLKPFKTVGQFNSYFQARVSRSGSQPIFLALDINRKLGISGFTNDKEELLDSLKQAILRYKEK